MRRFIFFAFSILFAPFAFAISPTIYYLQAKAYLDVNKGKLVTPANILIQDGKITAINPSSIPNSATKINKPNLILLPGLMDVHVHLPLDEAYFALSFVQDDDGMSTLRAVKNAKTMLLSGFTTIRSLGHITAGTSFIDVDIDKAANMGWLDAPHIISAGNAIGSTGGIMDPDMWGGYAPGILKMDYTKGIADGTTEVIKATRYQIKHGAKVIKIGATDGVIAENDDVGNEEYSYDEMKAIVDEANRHHIPVAAHAHGTEGINDAIKAGVSSIEHGSILNDESIRLMKQRGTYFVPSTYAVEAIDLKSLSPKMQNKLLAIRPMQIKSLKMAIDNHVNIAFGTDAPVVPYGDNAKQFTSFVRVGMKPIDAIRTATINAAKLLRLQDQGEIKVGNHADIIGVTDDPLLNISTLEHVIFVMKDGKLVKQ